MLAFGLGRAEGLQRLESRNTFGCDYLRRYSDLLLDARDFSSITRRVLVYR